MEPVAPFTRLALGVEADRLAAEVAALPDDVWQPHPEGIPGNTAVPLVAAGGDADDPATEGPMAPTPALDRLPYARSVLAALGAPVGRSRLMRIEAEGSLVAHVDTNRYWQDHRRVHVPVVTDPRVRFRCGDDEVHMAPGEVWVFDTWRRHGVDNPSGAARTHLVVDTVGSAAFGALLRAGTAHGLAGGRAGPVVAADDRAPVYESAPTAGIAPPWQQAALVDRITAALGPDASTTTREVLADLVADWRGLWAVHADDPAGHPAFADRARALDDAVAALPRTELGNGTPLTEAVRQLLVRPALAVADRSAARSAPPPRRRAGRRIVRPVFVVSPPRSGSSMLFEALARAAGVHTIGGESHRVVEEVPGLHPAAHDWASNALTAADATPEVVRLLEEGFVARARDRDGRPPVGLAPFRLLEKTPKNALRVPFLAAAFPDATFVHIHRDPREVLSSMLAAWESGRFATYPQLPGWPGAPWSLLLVPGWRDLVGRPLPEVVAHQWARTSDALLDALEALGPQRWVATDHAALVADPDAEARRLCGLLDLEWDRPLLDALPPSRTTLDPPAPDKWRRHEGLITEVWPVVAPSAERAVAASSARTGEVASPRRPAPSPRPAAAATDDTFSSVHTASFPELLATAGATVAVTTYQSGRVVLLRADAEGRLGTHLRAFPRPMGLAVAPGRIALGTDQAVWDLRDQPAVAARLPGPARHDACFVPRRAHVTGDVSIHELAFAGDELWVVATRFSCLATLDAEHSFVPRWRPAFVTALAAEDRCHLNGLAVVDGRPRYVSALAMTDTHQGWRSEKVDGGVVLDVDSGAVVAHGLSMPHSPRWHDGRLWVLDSGHGHLATVDLATGAAEPVVRLPGFPRGLAFLGPYALVGLSEVREHVFAGLPLAAHGDERRCGVWVVDTRTGEVAGFLRFEGDVSEVFDVQVLPGLRWPELLEPGDPVAAGAFVVPDAALADVP